MGEAQYELCGICRDEMREAKKLPCSHKFHLQCLMGWMRYKHTCPICRHSLHDPNGNDNDNAPAVANPNQAQNPAQAQAQAQNNNDNNNNMNLLPWWLRIFGSFIQIHNVDIIDARNMNVPRRRARAPRHASPQRVSTEEMINRISEVLGGTVSEQDIRTRLLRTHSV